MPIVAYGTTAVPHTVGDAGLVWDEPDPFLLAQSIDTVVRDAAVRRQLTERGWRRYQNLFANQRIERRLPPRPAATARAAIASEAFNLLRCD